MSSLQLPLFYGGGEGGGDVSWILNEVVLDQLAMGNMALTVYRLVWFAYVNQGVAITYLVELAESIAVGNMGRADYVQGRPTALRSITFVFPFAAYKYTDRSTQSGGTRWLSWLRHCATSRKVAVSVPDGVIGIFH